MEGIHMGIHPYRIFTVYSYMIKGMKKKLDFHSHPQYEIYFFHSGDADYLLGDQLIPLSPGDLIIMNGMTKHCPLVRNMESYTRTSFSFDPHLIQLFNTTMLACNPFQPFELLRNQHIRLDAASRIECEQLLKRIHRFYDKDDVVSYSRFLLALYDLLMFILDECTELINIKKSTISPQERYVQQMIDYIEEQYMNDIHIDNIADKLHMNKHHLMKTFRKVTGMTLSNFIYRRRINQAKILFIHQMDISVTEACFQAGFTHLAHFSRLFKKFVGVSPKQYKSFIRGSTIN